MFEHLNCPAPAPGPLWRIPWPRPAGPWALGVLVALAALMALPGLCGCGFGGFTPPPLPGPSIQAFSAARAVVTTGDSTELTAQFKGGTGTVEGVGRVDSGEAIPVGPIAATTTFTLTVTGSGGTQSAQVTVRAVPPPDAAITGPASVAAGGAYQASVPAQDGATFQWTASGATLDGPADGRTVQFRAAAFGLLKLTCTVTSAAGATASQDFTARLGGATILGFSAAPVVVSVGGAATLSYSFAGGTGELRPLGRDLGTGTDQMDITGTTSVTPGSSASYTLAVTDPMGRVATAAAAVQVVPLPVISSFQASPPIIGAGDGTSLTATFDPGPGGSAYVTFATGRVPIASGVPLATPDLERSAAFTLTVQNAAGAVATARTPVQVGSLETLAGVPSGEGSLDGFGPGARFYHPVGAALDAVGDLLVADTGNHTLRKITPEGQVLTLAGTEGVPGSQDGVEGQAGFDLPLGVAVDPTTGNTFVTDSGNGLVRLIAPSGEVSTVAGTAGLPGSADGTAGAASFNDPRGIAVRDDGSLLFVADTGNDTLRQILLATRGVTTLAGSPDQSGLLDGNGSAALFSGASGLVWDAAVTSSLFVADTRNNQVRRVDSQRNVTLVAGDPGGAPGVSPGLGPAAGFNAPSALAVDDAGTFYVADTGNNRIQQMDFDGTSGNVTPLAGSLSAGSADGRGASASFSQPQGLAATAGGDLYVVDTGNSTIRIIPADGPVRTLCGVPPAPGSRDGTGAQARMNGPSGIVQGPGGSLYVADTLNHSVRVVSPAGAVSTLAGTPGQSGLRDGPGAGQAGAAQFSGPAGVAVAAPGGVVTVYVADTGNNAIRRITLGPPVQVSTLAGGPGGQGGFSDSTGPGAQGALFNSPAGLAVDPQGNVLVADRDNNAIRRIAPDGTVSTVAGDPARAGTVDGAAGGPDVSFNRPCGLAVTVDGGTVYVADTGNHEIRMIRGGSVTTLAGAPEPGGRDGIGRAARLNAPVAVDLDGAGNLYVANQGGSTVCRITPAGEVLTFLGNPGLSGNLAGPLPALVANPRGIAVDRATGDLYLTTDDAVLHVAF